VKLRLQAVEPIDKVASSTAGGLRVYLDAPEAVPGLQAKLAGTGPGGKDQISIVVRLPEERREIEVALPQRYGGGPKLLMALRALPGVQAVEEI
jgi:DNA polymerase-3 subunit alpha